MAGKIIEILILLAGLLVTAAIVISIPLKSYNEYKDYLAQIEEQAKENAQAAIKPKVESLTVELKEGVRFFANDLADPKAEHFTVIANYIKGEEKYSEPVEEGDFTLNVPGDFYSKGGDVQITYKGTSATVSITLEPVVVETLKVLETPYTVKYAQGTAFDPAGMIIQAVYNDGSVKILTAEEYVVDTNTALTTSDNKVTVSYQIGDIIKTVDVEIGVSTTLDNGEVESIVIIGNPIVRAGSTVNTAIVEVNAVYESGNRKLLSADEYTISGSDDETTRLGKSYNVTVTYNADTTKTATAQAIIRHSLQGENGFVVGGHVKSETEYVVIDGVITKLDHEVSFAGGFSGAVTAGNEGSLTYIINCETKSTGSITMRCGNSYLVGSKGNYSMMPLQINTILDLTINGRAVRIPANVVLKGCGPHADYAPLFGIYYEFTFENVQLDPGQNEIKFNFKKSTVGATNTWGESPSTMNIDYVNFDFLGNEIPENYEIEKIELPEDFGIEFKQSLDSVKNIKLLATITGGAKISIDPGYYDVNIIGAQEGDTYFKFRTYKIEYTLKTNSNVKCSYEYTIDPVKSFTILNAYLELEGNKVYYVITGDSTGYDADDFAFYGDGKKYNMNTSFGEDNFVFKVDITDMKIGDSFSPRMTVEEKNYVNGVDGSGSIVGNNLKFTDGQSVYLNNQRYLIKATNGVPGVAVKEQVSDKDFFANFVYGTPGTETNGKDKNSDYPGGTGNLDGKDKYISYTFTLTEAGKVDFVWYIAGNKWNSGTKSNDGITDMSKHMTVTIDGKTLDVSGIALPAGTGDATSVWWNIQKVVFKDIELSAGTHTFKCLITTSGGLNVGSMEIYYTAN